MSRLNDEKLKKVTGGSEANYTINIYDAVEWSKEEGFTMEDGMNYYCDINDIARREEFKRIWLSTPNKNNPD